MMRVRNNSSIAAEIPAKPLAEKAPLYSRDAYAPKLSAPLDLATVPKIDNHQSLPSLLRDPSIASKNWIYRQYDHTVRTGTVVRPGSDAAVFHVRVANKFLAATTDCNSLYCRLDPREGGKIAVAEAARNLTCSGAKPLAVTDNLNFGNPYKPEIFWQLREAVEGAAEACRAFGTPVIGGNVSLYNESPAGAVDPTPTIAMVGLIEEERHITTQFFKKSGDVIIEFDGQSIADANQFKLRVAETNPGTTVPVKIKRNGETETFNVTLEQSTQNETANANIPKSNSNDQDALHGLVVADLDQQTRAQLNVPVNVRGALVTEVDPNSAAYEAGLRTGNAILQIGDKPVTDAQDVVTDTAKRTGNITLVRVWSREGIHYLTVKE